VDRWENGIVNATSVTGSSSIVIYNRVAPPQCGVSKQFHVGLGVFVAVWNVAASVLFALSLVSVYTPGTVVSLLGVPFLLAGYAGVGIRLPGSAYLDDEATMGVGYLVVGLGVVAAMTAPVVAGSRADTDLLVALLSILAGGTLVALGGAVAAGVYGLPGVD